MENKVKSPIVNVNTKQTDISSVPIYNDSDCHQKVGVHSSKSVIAIDGFLGMKVKAENVDVDNTDKSHIRETVNETGILKNVINQSRSQIQINEMSKTKIPLVHTLLSGSGPETSSTAVTVPVPVQGRKWYCCPFCRDVRLLQEKRKNLRVFATSVGLILHVKQCHPDKQEDKIDVLQLEQSNTISNHFKKSCYTKSLTKLTLSSPRTLLKQPSSPAPVQVPLPVKTRTPKFQNPKPTKKASILATSMQAPKPKPRKLKSLKCKSSNYNSNRPPTQTPGPSPGPDPNITTINDCSSQITKAVITQPFNTTLTSGIQTRTLKKTTARISSEVKNDECKENPRSMGIDKCKPNKPTSPLGLVMVPLSLGQNCKSVITHRKAKKMDVGYRIWNRPVTVKASTLTTLESNITYENSKAADSMNASAENMDGDVIIEKVIVKPKPKTCFHGHGVKKFSLDQISNKSDADNVGVGSGNVNNGDAAEALIKPIEFIDLTVEETDRESDSCPDSDCEEIIHISDQENEKKSKNPPEHSKRTTAHRHIPFQPQPEPTSSPSRSNGISNELFNNGIVSIQYQNVPDQTDQHQQASLVHIQPVIQVPDYAEEIEFEMGEHQPDNSSDDHDESVNDGSESEPMEYGISRRSPTSSASSNSEDLQVHPLDLDECTVDLLYNQMHNMFPRLYDLDQLMTTGTGAGTGN